MSFTIENAGFKGFSAHVSETVRVAHEGEVNKARYMPQDPMIIATKAVNGNVNIFDIRKHPSIPRDTVCRPNYILQGHTQEGYGLNWSPLQKGLLASGSDDRKVCLWDLSSPRDSTVFSPIREFLEQRDVVEDVAWHPIDPNLLAACGDDRCVFFYDIRKSRSLQSLRAHSREVNAISFNPVERFLFATASSDATIALWDFRALEKPLHELRRHTEEIYSLAWNPVNANILASAGVDRRVMIWDLSKIGESMPEGQEKEGPAELIFVHAGHTAKVNDISWNLDVEKGKRVKSRTNGR